MIVVIHGPRACGKTRNKEALAKAYNCDTIHDRGERPTVEALRQIERDERNGKGVHLILALDEERDYLKNFYMHAPGGVRLVPYATAAKRAGVK